MPQKKFIFIAIIISGLVGMAAQVIGLRQLTAMFQGNELTMGILFAAWLCWTALGGWIGSRIASAGTRTLGIAIVIQALFLPLILWLIRSSRGILGIQPGQIVGLFPIALSAIITLLPVALLTGLCFSLGCHAWREIHNLRTDNSPAGVQQVYIAEAIGAVIGGLSSFFLAFVIEPFPWVFLVAGIGLGAGIWTYCGYAKIGRVLWGIAIIIGMLLAYLGYPLERTTLAPLFAGQDIVVKKESPYGQLVAARIAEQTTLYINGIKEATVPDPFSAEDAAHIALALHPNPQHVLMIGGIIGETPREILKHPSVNQLDLVELDPNLIRMAKSVFPDSVTETLNDARVKVWTMDGRRVMTASQKQYDVILMNLPDPLNAQVNRFYTLEWFKEIRRHMTERGIFSFSIHSSENVMNREQAQFLACIYRTLEQAIPYVKVLPGANARFLASPDSNLLQLNADHILRRLESRGIETVYVSPAYLPDICQPFRMQQLDRRIREQAVQINHDFVPVGYYTGLVLWDTHFRTSLKGTFLWLRKVSFGYLLLFVGVITLALFGISMLRKGRVEGSLPMAIRIAIFSVGAAGIGMEILVILAFQVVFGVVYGWVAIIITAFMAGLAIGARLIQTDRVTMKWFVLIQICMAAIPLALWFLIIHSRALMGYPPALGAVLFGLGALVVGALGGAQFPIATTLLVKQQQAKIENSRLPQSSARIGGGLYALDLLGSSLGAIVLSAFIVPLWGLGSAFILLAMLNLIPLAILINRQ